MESCDLWEESLVKGTKIAGPPIFKGKFHGFLYIFPSNAMMFGFAWGVFGRWIFLLK
jgi:hypothetical protein